MARPQSVATGGYFPTPPSLLPALASLVEFDRPPYLDHVIVDPCAGDGHAITELAALWFPNTSRNLLGAPVIHGIEIEAERHRSLAARLDASCALHADAFRVAIAGADRPGAGASLLFLNPPYDSDRHHGRLEQRFLDRWTSCLAPGAGLLLFLVPHAALLASARHLACHFDDLRAWRFPEPHFATYGQCVVAARRREIALPEHGLLQHRVERWAADPSQLPVLQPLAAPAYRVALSFPNLSLAATPIDLPLLLASASPPWLDSSPAAHARTARELFGTTYPVALPPRPAHIALALSSGLLNGQRIEADRPGLPPLLVKGTLDRPFITAEERHNSDGDLVGSVQVQRPRLTLHVLRLDTWEFHQLRHGTTPTGATSIATCTTADLLDRYSQSLRDLMGRQFPPLHDPSNPAHTLSLPRLGRHPYDWQLHLICAGLKLLGRGDHPVIAAEVGTGKSTIALSIAGALEPRHHSRIAAELRRLGCSTRHLPCVRRLLIVCPPHLLKSWSDQAAAVLPLHRVVVVDSAADLARDGQIFLLSREAAKLGYRVRGLSSRSCPRCGADLTLPAEALAATRSRCQAVARLPVDRIARVAHDLAAVLLPSYPTAASVQLLLSRHRVLRSLLQRASDEAFAHRPARPLDPTNLRPHVAALLNLVEESAGAGDPARSRRLVAALHRLCLAADLQDEIATGLTHAATDSAAGTFDRRSLATDLRRPRPAYSEEPDALAALDFLADLGTWRLVPCGEPLFQAEPSPRRYPLARWIQKRHRHRFDLLILDEAHQFSTPGSAQEKAAHRLAGLPGIATLALTGSLMGGYASSVFANFWALSERFRQEFLRDELQAFVTRYGFRKIWVPAQPPAGPTVVAYGATTDRETRAGAADLGEAPGILPTFLLRHLLPIGLIMHKADLDRALPPYAERPVPIRIDPRDPRDAELIAQYRHLLTQLSERIRRDRYTPLEGKLWGAMAEAPSYLDRATDDLQPFIVRYPDDAGGAVIAAPRMLPAAWRSPKERWALSRLADYLQAGRNILLFLRHTGTGGLARRWQRLVRQHLGQELVVLDPRKVRPLDREAWLDQHVVRTGRRILLTNPRAVETGLNNLVHFSCAIWVEGLDFDARTVRQANGRLHRIGQHRDVLVEIPYYHNTVQQAAFDLIAAKLSASEQVDGLSLESALQIAGTGNADTAQTVLGMGQAIYQAWLGNRRS